MFGLARVLSKLGYCSRSQAWRLINARRVRVNGAVEKNPERRVDSSRDRIEVDGQLIRAERKVYLMLNKRRGLVTTTSDEQGRATVFRCLEGCGLPFVSPVGRLDKASEGLLLFTNDTAWAAQIADPKTHLDKTYHVQVDRLAGEDFIRRLQRGAMVESEPLKVKHLSVLRHGERNSWLEVVLDEGKNRQIRRLMAALDVEVLRLIRISIGPIKLGNLAKGGFRHLTEEEVRALRRG
ncbi:MAG: rRNA pseudouridine synthase [Verrucomicrobia bacterium]|nr:rRNA pseudouridine synthase [Verrucomicrobiota bacterium]